MNLDFNFNQTSPGVLNPKDLSFFYYGVGLEKMTNAPILYNWDEGIQAFVDSKQMTIEGLDENEVNTLDENFEKDKILFLIKANETKEESLFRHLRNAFAHYNIRRDGDYFIFKDINYRTNSVTMIGSVNGDDLKELCFRFYDQRAAYEESLRLNEE